jgi:nucleotide-binding universal stress UspA family protein
MYKKILVTLDATPTDRFIIDHIKQLALELKSNVVPFHVATGVPAQVHGAGAAGQEVDEDSEYLAEVETEFHSAGVPAKAELAFGDPFTEIVKRVEEGDCDLVAMGTHGHGLLADVFFGTTASRVQHNTSVPVLLLRGR